jgi:signal peptidase I
VKGLGRKRTFYLDEIISLETFGFKTLSSHFDVKLIDGKIYRFSTTHKRIESILETIFKTRPELIDYHTYHNLRTSILVKDHFHSRHNLKKLFLGLILFWAVAFFVMIFFKKELSLGLYSDRDLELFAYFVGKVAFIGLSLFVFAEWIFRAKLRTQLSEDPENKRRCSESENKTLFVWSLLYLCLTISTVLHGVKKEWYIYDRYIATDWGMYPYLKESEPYLVNKRYRSLFDRFSLEVGDVVHYMIPNKEYFFSPIDPFIRHKKRESIARIVATEGDEVRFSNKGIFINEVLLKKMEPIKGNFRDALQLKNFDLKRETLGFDTTYHIVVDNHSGRKPASVYKETMVVPENHLFLLSDNRTTLLDSRTLGFIHIDMIKGKVYPFLKKDNK